VPGAVGVPPAAAEISTRRGDPVAVAEHRFGLAGGGDVPVLGAAQSDPVRGGPARATPPGSPTSVRTNPARAPRLLRKAAGLKIRMSKVRAGQDSRITRTAVATSISSSPFSTPRRNRPARCSLATGCRRQTLTVT